MLIDLRNVLSILCRIRCAGPHLWHYLSVKLQFLCTICHNKRHTLFLQCMKPHSLSHTSVMSHSFLCQKSHFPLVVFPSEMH
jgi:hypothetical protein